MEDRKAPNMNEAEGPPCLDARSKTQIICGKEAACRCPLASPPPIPFLAASCLGQGLSPRVGWLCHSMRSVVIQNSSLLQLLSLTRTPPKTNILWLTCARGSRRYTVSGHVAGFDHALQHSDTQRIPFRLHTNKHSPFFGTEALGRDSCAADRWTPASWCARCVSSNGCPPHTRQTPGAAPGRPRPCTCIEGRAPQQGSLPSSPAHQIACKGVGQESLAGLIRGVCLGSTSK
jgi:hypothetical protein